MSLKSDELYKPGLLPLPYLSVSLSFSCSVVTKLSGLVGRLLPDPLSELRRGGILAEAVAMATLLFVALVG